jgi:hypothetical protein
MKTCTKCGQKKPLSEFHNSASAKDGKFSACKVCRNYYGAEKRKSVDQSALYRAQIERIGKEAAKQKRREYYQRNKEAAKARAAEWREKNPERHAELRKRHYEENKARYLERAKEWGAANRVKRTEICLRYIAKKREESPEEYVATVAARKMLARVLAATGHKKRGKTFSIIGYTRQELADHMQALFQPGMSWDNHGQWHIDHIIPVSELVRLGVTDPAKINALSNLRPIWAGENLAKSDSFALAPPETATVTRARKCYPKKLQTTAQTC